MRRMRRRRGGGGSGDGGRGKMRVLESGYICIAQETEVARRPMGQPWPG